jgi:hypothetical protein
MILRQQDIIIILSNLLPPFQRNGFIAWQGSSIKFVH